MLRGVIISFSASKKRQKRERQNLLMADFKTKENAYVECPSTTILTEISAIRTTLDNLLTQDEEVKVRFKDKSFMNMGINLENTKHISQKKEQSQTIAALCDAQGSCIYDNKLINDTFKIFYHDLYSTEQPGDASVLMDEFFDQLNLPTIPSEHKLALNSPISREEVFNAIGTLQNGKAGGPDGYSSEFYKVFKRISRPFSQHV